MYDTCVCTSCVNVFMCMYIYFSKSLWLHWLWPIFLSGWMLHECYFLCLCYKRDRAFTSEEDDRLTEAINLYGDSKWRMGE